MPKILDYPRDSLFRSLELAEAADSLGGSATIDLCAEKLGRKNSGAFAALVGAAGKYGFVEVSKSRISTTDLFTRYKHAYDEAEKKGVLAEAINNVPVFAQLIERFEGKTVPEDILEKMLVREFRVSTREASKVANYFLEAIGAAGVLNGASDIPNREASDDHVEEPAGDIKPPKSRLSSEPEDGDFRVTIVGPGFHSEIKIVDEDDLAIVEAMLSKVRRKLSEEP